MRDPIDISDDFDRFTLALYTALDTLDRLEWERMPCSRDRAVAALRELGKEADEFGHCMAAYVCTALDDGIDLQKRKGRWQWRKMWDMARDAWGWCWAARNSKEKEEGYPSG